MNISPYLVLYKVTEYNETGPTNTLLMMKGMKCEEGFKLKKFNFFRLAGDDEPERYYVAIAKMKQKSPEYLKILLSKKIFKVGEYRFKLTKNIKRPLFWELQCLNYDRKNFNYIEYVDNRIKKIYEFFGYMLPFELVGIIVDKLFW